MYFREIPPQRSPRARQASIGRLARTSDKYVAGAGTGVLRLH